ncbi:hypothetical protein PQX77_002901 [Marasmius sp. AFHP31]|nr:hypothetical protein PQX77_002901 [Marasmius sp. AFHP31]
MDRGIGQMTATELVTLVEQIVANRSNANMGSNNATGTPQTTTGNAQIVIPTPGKGDESIGGTQGTVTSPLNQAGNASASSPTLGRVNTPGAGGAAPADALLCPHCHQPVILSGSDDRWYAIWVGRRVGWIRGWDRMDCLTQGVSGQAMRYCISEEAARSLFIEKQSTGFARQVPDSVNVDFVVPPGEGQLYP